MCRVQHSLALGIAVGLLGAFEGLRAGDCNGNDRDDLEDVRTSESPDCDANGVPDECQLTPRFLQSEASFPMGVELTAVVVAEHLTGGRPGSDLFAASLEGRIWAIDWREGRWIPRASVRVGKSVFSLASGDLDGDRRDELIAHDPRGGEVFILRRGAEGALEVAQSLRVGDEEADRCGPLEPYPCYASSSSLVIADLDNDRDLDIAVSNLFPEDRIAVLLNNGTGELAEPVAYAAFREARDVVSGDIDGDGDADLLTYGPASDTVFRNGGAGTFDEREELDLDADAMALADVDGDGRTELLTASDGSLGIWSYEPEGRAWKEARVINGLGDIRRILPVDRDLDRDVDLILVGSDTATVLSNEDGRFGVPETFVIGLCEVRAAAFGPVASPYVLELAAVSEREFYRPSESQTFLGVIPRPLRVETDGEVGRLVVSDLNGDRIDDFAVTVRGGATPGVSIAVFHGVPGFLESAGTLALGGGEETSLASIDLDGDPFPELLVGGPGRVSVLRNDIGRLRVGAGLAIDGSPVALVTEDLDGDGDSDLAAVSDRGPGLPALLSVFPNDGAGGFAAARNLLVEGSPRDAAAADLDGDGDEDLAVARAARDVLVLVNDGTGRFSEGRPVSPGRPGFARRIAARDLDGDGNADLMLGLDDAFVVLWGSQGGAFDERTSIEAPAFELTAGDIDGDGDVDVVLPAAGRLLLNLGSRDLAGVRLTCPVLGSAGLGDFDAVVGLDIALAPWGSRSVEFLVQNRSTRRDADRNGVLDPCEDIPVFRRGDIDADGRSNLTDAIVLLNFLFRDGPEPPCRDSADVDDTGRVEITDAVVLLGSLFEGSRTPEPPVATCGLDRTDDELTCESFPPCR